MQNDNLPVIPVLNEESSARTQSKKRKLKAFTELDRLYKYFSERILKRSAELATAVLLFYSVSLLCLEILHGTFPTFSGTVRGFIAILAFTSLSIDLIRWFGYPSEKGTPLVLILLSTVFAVVALPTSRKTLHWSSERDSPETLDPTPANGVWEICLVIIICHTMTPQPLGIVLPVTIGLPLAHTTLVLTTDDMENVQELVSPNFHEA